MNFSRVLSDVQVEEIHHASETLLEKTGFRVQDEALVLRCAAAGASVEETSGIVRFPRALLRECVAKAPKSYTLRGVDGRAWEIGGGTPWGLAIVTDPWIIDYASRMPRRPRFDDLRRHTMLAERQPHVAALSRMDFPVEDIEGPHSSLFAWEAYLLHTAKHHYFPSASPASNAIWCEIIGMLAGDRDPRGAGLFSVMAAVISPLTLSRDNAGLLRLAVEYGAPVVPTICPMAGSTGPCSMAGMLTLGHAENLAMAALTQLLAPGNPFLYTFGPSVTDFRTGHDLYYTLDKVLWKIASVQLGRHCGLPVSAECGGTMTHRYDPQNGMEGMLFMLAAVASGAAMLSGFGSCYCAVGMSGEMMLIQEAWRQAAMHLEKGIRTNGPLLGLESLTNAGPGGDFLTDMLTLEYQHGGAFFQHPLFDYSPAGGSGKSMLERAREEVEAMTATIESPLPGTVQEKLRQYFRSLRG